MSNENLTKEIKDLFYEILNEAGNELKIRDPVDYLSIFQIENIVSSDEACIVRIQRTPDDRRLELWTRIVPRKGPIGLQKVAYVLQSINFYQNEERLNNFCAIHSITQLLPNEKILEDFNKLNDLYSNLIQSHLKGVDPSSYLHDFAVSNVISKSERERLKQMTSQDQIYELWMIILLGKGKTNLPLIAEILKKSGYAEASNEIFNYCSDNQICSEENINSLINFNMFPFALQNNNTFHYILFVIANLASLGIGFLLMWLATPKSIRPSDIVPILTTPSPANFSLNIDAVRLVGINNNTLAVIYNYNLSVIDVRSSTTLATIPTELTGYVVTDITYNNKYSFIFVTSYTNLEPVARNCFGQYCFCDPHKYNCFYRRTALSQFHWNCSSAEIKRTNTKFFDGRNSDPFPPPTHYPEYLDRISSFSSDFMHMISNVSKISDYLVFNKRVLVSSMFQYNFRAEPEMNLTCFIIDSKYCEFYGNFDDGLNVVDISVASYPTTRYPNINSSNYDDELVALLLEENITHVAVLRFQNGEQTKFNFETDTDLKTFGNPVAIAFTDNGNILIATRNPNSILLMTLLNIYNYVCCALMLPASPTDMATVGSNLFVAFGQHYPVQVYSMPTKCGYQDD